MPQFPALETVKKVVVLLLERRDIFRPEVDRDPLIGPGRVENRPVEFPGVDHEKVMLIERIALSLYKVGHISREEVIYLIPVVDMDRVFGRSLLIGSVCDIELVFI